MFVVYYKSSGKPVRYFHPTKGLQKTVRTAWAFPEAAREMMEQAASETLKIRSVAASPVAEAMYPNGVQYNQMKW